jgi:dihydroorotase
MDTISIIKGRVIDPATKLDLVTDLHIADGKIIAIGKAPADFTAVREINAQNKIVCPGFIDLSVRLREPGAEYKATIISETEAAAKNGITTVCCPPDTDPVIDSPAIAELLQQRAAKAGMAKVLPIAALTKGLKGEHLAEMGILKQIGCVAVSDVQPIVNTNVLRNALEYAATYDFTVFLHPIEPWLGNSGCAHEGIVSTRLGLTAIPEQTETIAVARDLLLVEMTGVRAHFCRLSSGKSVEMIKQAQDRGLAVTADVSAHHLLLSDIDIHLYDSQCHVYPPLRSCLDKETLREGLKNNIINVICSDHQPHEAEAKLSPFSMTSAGISGLDTLLPQCLRFAEEMNINLITLLSYLTDKPAKILGIDAGSLQVGKVADVCIFDPNKHWTLNQDTMYSMGYNSPFFDQELKGRVYFTIINGKVVYEYL